MFQRHVLRSAKSRTDAATNDRFQSLAIISRRKALPFNAVRLNKNSKGILPDLDYSEVVCCRLSSKCMSQTVSYRA